MGSIKVSDSVALENLTLSYLRHPVVHHLSGCFRRGELTALVGPNGGGKSSLLRALAGLFHEQEGTLRFIGPHKIGYLPQQSHLDVEFPLRLVDLVTLGLSQEMGWRRGVSSEMERRVEEALEITGLQSLRNRGLDALSVGQRQRALFARLIVQDADLLLLDEPFNGLDLMTTERLLQLCLEWARQGRTVIVSLHQLELVKEYFPQTLLLAREKVAWGESAQVLTRANLLKAREQLNQAGEGARVCDWESLENEVPAESSPGSLR